MKKITLIAVACSLLPAGAGWLMAAGDKTDKVAYVDMQKIFQNYNKAKETEKVFKKEVDDKQEEINKLQGPIKALQDELEKKKDILKPEDKKKKEDDLKDKMQEYVTKAREINQQLDQKREELEKVCLQEIVNAVKEYGKKQGYRAILDARVVLYGPDESDVSADIIKVLNK